MKTVNKYEIVETEVFRSDLDYEKGTAELKNYGISHTQLLLNAGYIVHTFTDKYVLMHLSYEVVIADTESG